MPPRTRHSWVKIRLHVYLCRRCGTGRVNAQSAHGGWFTTFHLPDGSSRVDAHVPLCEVGPRTPVYLKRYESAVACSAE